MIHNKITFFLETYLRQKHKEMIKVRIENLYGSPHSKSKRNPRGGREEPSLNSPSNQNQRNENWNSGLLLQEMVEKVHSSLFNVNWKGLFLQAHCFALGKHQNQKREVFGFKFWWLTLLIPWSVNFSYPCQFKDQGQRLMGMKNKPWTEECLGVDKSWRVVRIQKILESEKMKSQLREWKKNKLWCSIRGRLPWTEMKCSQVGNFESNLKCNILCPSATFAKVPVPNGGSHFSTFLHWTYYF